MSAIVPFKWMNSSSNAAAILRDGFVDRAGNYLTDQLHSGVWLSNEPLDCNEGAHGDILLEVAFECTTEELAEYEWVEEGKPYREWLIPAAIVNPRARIRIVDEEGQLLSGVGVGNSAH